MTEMNKGKHHIGDFLPPQELDKFIEKAKAIKEGRSAGEPVEEREMGGRGRERGGD